MVLQASSFLLGIVIPVSLSATILFRYLDSKLHKICAACARVDSCCVIRSTDLQVLGIVRILPSRSTCIIVRLCCLKTSIELRIEEIHFTASMARSIVIDIFDDRLRIRAP